MKRSFWDPEGTSFFAFVVAIYRSSPALTFFAIGAALFLLVALSGCADQGEVVNGFRSQDYWGNAYPPECMRDLNDVNVPVTLASKATMAELAKHTIIAANGRPLLGYFQHHPPHIYILNTLHGKELTEAIRHEKCHVLAGEWHQ